MSPSLSSPAERARLALLALGALALGAASAITIVLAGLGLRPPAQDLPQTLAGVWKHRTSPLAARWIVLGALAGALPIAGFTVLVQGSRPTLHGRARFASEPELRAANLRARAGLIVGRRNGAPLVFGGDEHLLLYAPTRSGKGVGLVIPNLLAWPGSVVVLDIKRENWTATAGFRAAHGQAVYCFDPLDAQGRTHCYNPLGHIPRHDAAEVLDELQRIAVMLFPVPARADPFWAESARTGFIGLGALAAASDGPFSFGEIYRLLAQPDLRTRLTALLTDPERDLSAGARTALTDFCGASENTFAGVRQTITSKISLWLNPRVDAATTKSDFDLRRLRDASISLYLCASLDNLDRVAPLYGLLFQQLIDLSTRALPSDGRHQTPVLVLLDEFARLGAAHVLAHAFSYVAGYGLRLLPVLQSPAQLRAAYGRDLAEDIIANCGAEVVFAPKDLRVAQELSERLGAYDYESRSRSRPAGLAKGSRTVTLADHRRLLMLPQELMQMSRERLLVFRAGTPPITGTKIRYWRERAFTSRVRPPPIVPPHGGQVSQPPPRPLPTKTRPMTAAEIEGRDPLTLAMIEPNIDAAGLDPLRPDATAEEAIAWIETLVDAGLRSEDPPR
ncbi:conjugal transfer protein TraG [Phenylobacterium sp. Root77]|jgi:type IV secretion system protein VirD4|uniref:type IV secretory system conjugative DNA transfer family protein n=1 Tax=unclassified Phenylobacterium TaxID=2640670 RepID=UPI0006FF6BBE|nr:MULTISPECIES: type IV secretory system conjugative DNA transfer family protein [unclassified Phenylobacterium]KQW67031.1 conjugal transfer protein TraG [Phenylobacterium sp. Root1277]KQW89724.1 conjugal transfer protein TraG [Phenylobacterium sp. Root1290]KRC43587.1 conjugal transfer protein TraG [Phenylobacterium sp. Root77]